MTSAAVSGILRALGDRGLRRTGDGWQARCPAHEDQRASLSIGEGKAGAVVLYCHAGCETAAIVEALGLGMQDLFAEAPPHAPRGRGRIVATYGYRDETGALLYEVVRFEPKDFRQRRPDGRGGWTWSLGDARRVLYMLPELLAADPDAPVFVVEGEKDADRLRDVGLIATTNAGGAGKWRAEYCTALRARRVVILPDNDEPGRKHGEQVAAALAGVAASVRTVELPGAPAKGDVSDWIGTGGTVRALLEMAEQAMPHPGEEHEPGDHDSPPSVSFVSDRGGDARPAGRRPAEYARVVEALIPLGRVPVPAFPVDVLPSPLREFAAALTEDLQVPADVPALLGLAAVAACVQRRHVLEVRAGYTEPLALYVAAILESGERKSACVEAVTGPIAEWERAEAKRLGPAIEEERSRRAIARKRQEARETEAAKAKNSEVRQAAEVEAGEIAAHLAASPEPVYPRVLADDVTPEALARLMADHGERLALFSAEGGVFETMAGRYSSGKPNLDVYLKGHAGDWLRVDRRSGPPVVMHSPALTMGLAVQPDVLRALIDKPGFRGRGLLARYLYALPASRVGHRRPSSPPVPSHVREGYAACIRGLLDSPAVDGGEAVRLRLSQEARATWQGLAGRIEVRMRAGGDLAHLRDWAGKAAGLAVRLAGIMHLAGRGSGTIDLAVMKAAVTIVEGYAIPHALAAFAEMGADPELDAARIVVDWITARGAHEVSVRDAHQGLRGQSRFARAEAVQRALGVAAQHGYLRALPPPPRTGAGRVSSPRYSVCPGAWGHPQNPQNPQNGAAQVNSEDIEDASAGWDAGDTSEGAAAAPVPVPDPDPDPEDEGVWA